MREVTNLLNEVLKQPVTFGHLLAIALAIVGAFLAFRGAELINEWRAEKALSNRGIPARNEDKVKKAIYSPKPLRKKRKGGGEYDW